MALIEKYITYAANYPVVANAIIIEGQWVKLDTDGTVILAVGASSEVPLGVSGDTKSTSTSGIPSLGDSSVGPFVNRVSDSFDETKASGHITVYTNGEFFTNQYVTGDNWAINSPCYVFTDGTLTITAPNSGPIVGRVTVLPGAFDSGVPGSDINGSLSLGNYLGFRMTNI